MNRNTLAALFVALCITPAARADPASDVIGAWKISGSVFFNAVDTICHAKQTERGIVATCETDAGPGAYLPLAVEGTTVRWSWDSGPAVLTFEATMTSDHTMRGRIFVRGFIGRFNATKE